MKVGLVKIYDTNPEILKLLSGTKIRVSIMVTNNQILNIALDQAMADNWVNENVLAYYPETMIRFILVGNEILSTNDREIWHLLVPAMVRIHKSIEAAGINNIKIGTPLAMDILESTFPPSSGKFRPNILDDQVILPLLHFIYETNSYFFLDVYPYFSWSTNPINTAALDFALFKTENSTYEDPETGLVYTNLLDQMLDSVIFAIRKAGFSNIKLAIAETGWPNAGDIDQTGANIHNAATYNRKLVQKMRAKPPIGTPAQPGVTIPTFIFSLYDENQKQGPGTERHWGLLQPSGWPNYELDFTGEKSDLEYGMLPEPLNDEPYKGKIWCVVATGVNEMELSPALDFACNQGEGICDELAPGKTCHKQISVTTHASYAFSSYWAKFRNQGATCYFNGLATQTTIDPSKYKCFILFLRKTHKL